MLEKKTTKKPNYLGKNRVIKDCQFCWNWKQLEKFFNSWILRFWSSYNIFHKLSYFFDYNLNVLDKQQGLSFSTIMMGNVKKKITLFQIIDYIAITTKFYHVPR